MARLKIQLPFFLELHDHLFWLCYLENLAAIKSEYILKKVFTGELFFCSLALKYLTRVTNI